MLHSLTPTNPTSRQLVISLLRWTHIHKVLQLKVAVVHLQLLLVGLLLSCVLTVEVRETVELLVSSLASVALDTSVAPNKHCTCISYGTNRCLNIMPVYISTYDKTQETFTLLVTVWVSSNALLFLFSSTTSLAFFLRDFIIWS